MTSRNVLIATAVVIAALVLALAFFRIGIFGTTAPATTTDTAPVVPEDQASIDQQLDAIDTGADLEADFSAPDEEIGNL